MARKTVTDVLTQIASTVNQSATAPTVGSDEHNLWLQYMNRAQDEWAEAFNWESLRQHFWPTVTTASLASISLPIHFDTLAAPIQLFKTGSSDPDIYSLIIDEDEDLYESTSLYARLTGDNATGKTLVFNPPTMASGASLYIQYFASPSTLSHASQYIIMDDSQFIVDRTIAYIFESRSDPRFQIEETKARERLLSMVEGANEAKYSSYASVSYVPSTLGRAKFRVGRD